MDPNHSSEGLPSDSKCKKAGLSLMEQTRVLDRLRSGMSYSAADHEFDVKESTVYVK